MARVERLQEVASMPVVVIDGDGNGDGASGANTEAILTSRTNSGAD